MAVSDFREAFIEGNPRLAIRDYGGSGSAVLLVHGIGRTLEDWRLLAPLLRDEHRVVALDLRLHGHSGEGGWSWDELVVDLERVCQHLALGRTAIIGQSLGGILAGVYAARHSDCPAAINIDGHGWLPPERFPGLPPNLAREQLAWMKDWMARQASALDTPMPEATFRAMLDAQKSLAEQLGVPVEVLVASTWRAAVHDAHGDYRLRPSGEALRTIQELTNETDLFAVYAQVTTPLLIFQLTAPIAPSAPDMPPWLHGFLDSFAEGLKREHQALVHHQPNIEVMFLEAPHLATLSHPAALASRILSFLARVAPSERLSPPPAG
ncbi:alpha/beta hydrolase [Archangium violaceum]|uniref:alpha/beta fold hydrolase n=1 Tax=Archangium violaceum TaxID=83451 RepID=UPI00193BCE1E|nr:alpha/beta hydrolase [Archangium violaceum]QRK07612.1 alpha/beta hydrolase [Archangium violaceum]